MGVVKTKRAELPRDKRAASLVDVANNIIIKIEAGKNQNLTLDTLTTIAEAVSVDDLIQ